jgi:transposase
LRKRAYDGGPSFSTNSSTLYEHCAKTRRDLLAEGQKQSALKILREIPTIGPIRAALLIALIQTPHRFRTKRQLWTYSGLAVDTRDSAQHRYVDGQLQRSKNPSKFVGSIKIIITI